VQRICCVVVGVNVFIDIPQENSELALGIASIFGFPLFVERISVPV